MAHYQFNPRKTDYESEGDFLSFKEKLDAACRADDIRLFLELKEERQRKLKQCYDAIRRKTKRQERQMLQCQLSPINPMTSQQQQQHQHHQQQHHQHQQQEEEDLQQQQEQRQQQQQQRIVEYWLERLKMWDRERQSPPKRKHQQQRADEQQVQTAQPRTKKRKQEESEQPRQEPHEQQQHQSPINPTATLRSSTIGQSRGKRSSLKVGDDNNSGKQEDGKLIEIDDDSDDSTDSNILGEPLLVFPFKADEEVFSRAASNLKELREAREIPGGGSIHSVLNETDVKLKGSSRSHYITIREGDIDRLAPGEFLNDVLVDFWMKWISGAPNNTNADVHIFTSHFMSTLASDGPKVVSSWTAKKKIDIFEKKLIFVPVNSDLHWSLAVVVNPGFIANNSDEEIYEDSRTDEGSFLLFLDSLTMHRKQRIASDIYKWLNFEWKRLKKGKVNGSSSRVFGTQTMPLLTPKIPYQNNGCDCGVFVCRYAYNLFQMRNKYIFSQYDLFTCCNKLFKECRLFEFGMEDIARIREEMKSLINNLSTYYLTTKQQQETPPEQQQRQLRRQLPTRRVQPHRSVREKPASTDQTMKRKPRRHPQQSELQRSKSNRLSISTQETPLSSTEVPPRRVQPHRSVREKPASTDQPMKRIKRKTIKTLGKEHGINSFVTADVMKDNPEVKKVVKGFLDELFNPEFRTPWEGGRRGLVITVDSQYGNNPTLNILKKMYFKQSFSDTLRVKGNNRLAYVYGAGSGQSSFGIRKSQRYSRAMPKKLLRIRDMVQDHMERTFRGDKRVNEKAILNTCEVIIYYDQKKFPYHRDITFGKNGEYIKAKNSQEENTVVCVFVVGDTRPLMMALHDSKSGKMVDVTIKEIPLANGTIFYLHPSDEEDFMRTLRGVRYCSHYEHKSTGVKGGQKLLSIGFVFRSCHTTQWVKRSTGQFLLPEKDTSKFSVKCDKALIQYFKSSRVKKDRKYLKDLYTGMATKYLS